MPVQVGESNKLSRAHTYVWTDTSAIIIGCIKCLHSQKKVPKAIPDLITESLCYRI